MEEQIFIKVFERYGISGLILIFLFWKHFLYPQWRKRSGEFVHWNDLKQKLDEDNEKLKRLERLLNSQLEKELEKERRMNAIEILQTNLERNLAHLLQKMNENIETNNRLQGKIKDALQDLTDKK